MGEGMAHFARQCGPIGIKRRTVGGQGLRPLPRRPSQHPAQQSLVRAALQQPCPRGIPCQIDGPIPGGFGFLGAPLGQIASHSGLARQTFILPRACTTGWRAHRADRRPQIHHRLRIITRAQIRRQAGGLCLQLGLGSRQRSRDFKQSRHDAFHIAIHHHFGAVKGNGGNGGGGVGADARQRDQTGMGIGKRAIMRFANRPRAFQQVAGTGVIAKPRPFAHHITIFGRRQRLNSWPAGNKAVKVPCYGPNGGLLQHHFGQPHRIGVRALPRLPIHRGHPPRHHPRVIVIPAQQGRRPGRLVHL